MKVRRSVTGVLLVGVLLLWSSCGATTPGNTSATLLVGNPLHPIPAGSSAPPSQVTHLAAKLARGVVLPVGSKPMEAAVHVPYLGIIDGGDASNSVDSVLGWRVPLSGSNAVGFLTNHAMTGSTVTYNGRFGGQGMTERQLVLSDQLPPGAIAKHPETILTITYMPGQSTSLLRVDGRVVWSPPIPTGGSPVPFGASSVVINLTDPVRSPHNQTRTVDSGSAQRLARMIDHLRVSRKGTTTCALDRGISLSMQFKSATHSPLATVTDSLACGNVTVMSAKGAVKYLNDDLGLFYTGLADLGLTSDQLVEPSG